jgi:hypothetical protein
MNLDLPFLRFLESEFRALSAFAAANPDLLLVIPEPGKPPASYFITFTHCPGFAITRAGEVREHSRWIVELRVPANYLAEVVPPALARVVSPSGALSPWSPNIAPVTQHFCPGHIPPGTQLEYLVRQYRDILSWRRLNTRDPLNPNAALWALANRDRYPLPRRELLRARAGGVAP